jgi:hypothetical protein
MFSKLPSVPKSQIYGINGKLQESTDAVAKIMNPLFERFCTGRGDCWDLARPWVPDRMDFYQSVPGPRPLAETFKWVAPITDSCTLNRITLWLVSIVEQFPPGPSFSVGPIPKPHFEGRVRASGKSGGPAAMK